MPNFQATQYHVVTDCVIKTSLFYCKKYLHQMSTYCTPNFRLRDFFSKSKRLEKKEKYNKTNVFWDYNLSPKVQIKVFCIINQV